LGIRLAGFKVLALVPVAMLTLGRAALVPATVATLWLATGRNRPISVIQAGARKWQL
jgi:hypothetical protein